MKEESLAGLHCRLGAPSVPDRHALHGLPGQVASHTWVLQLRKTMGFTEENLPEHMATSTVFNVLGSTVTQELPLEGKAVCMFGKNMGGGEGTAWQDGTQSQFTCTISRKLPE